VPGSRIGCLPGKNAKPYCCGDVRFLDGNNGVTFRHPGLIPTQLCNRHAIFLFVLRWFCKAKFGPFSTDFGVFALPPEHSSERAMFNAYRREEVLPANLFGK
jgi:hypothetical protein